jgi:hypothetical protein
LAEGYPISNVRNPAQGKGHASEVLDIVSRWADQQFFPRQTVCIIDPNHNVSIWQKNLDIEKSEKQPMLGIRFSI